MNKTTLNIFRSNDQWHAVVKIQNNYRQPYDIMCVEFRRNTEPLPIIKTTSGSTSDNKLWIRSKCKTVEVEILAENFQSCECIMSYLRFDELVHYEGTELSLFGIKKIYSTDIKCGVTDNVSLYSSPWQLNLAVKNDIIASVIKRGKQTQFFCLGEIGTTLLAADFLFSLSPSDESILIPKEVLWKRHDLFTTHELGVSELIKVNSVPFTNVHGKSLISNRIRLDEIPQRTPRLLSDFTSPLGERLEQGWEIHPTSYLPVYTGHK